MSKKTVIPSKIKQRLLNISNRAKKNFEDTMVVEKYFIEELGLDIDDVRSGDGCSLEEFEYGNYPIEEFEKYIKYLIEEKRETK